MIITPCTRMAGFRLSPVVTMDGGTMFHAKLEGDSCVIMLCLYLAFHLSTDVAREPFGWVICPETALIGS